MSRGRGRPRQLAAAAWMTAGVVLLVAAAILVTYTVLGSWG